MLSSYSSYFHNIIKICKSSEYFFKLSVLDTVHICVLAIDAFTFEFILVPRFANIANISKIASWFVCKELLSLVIIINVYFTLVDKIDSLQDDIDRADVFCVVVDIL